MDYCCRHELYERYKLWRIFFDRRCVHLNERRAVSRVHDVDLLLGTIACQQQAMHAEERAQTLLADAAQIRGRIRASHLTGLVG